MDQRERFLRETVRARLAFGKLRGAVACELDSQAVRGRLLDTNIHNNLGKCTHERDKS